MSAADTTYIALSYCWGKTAALATRTLWVNVEARMYDEGIHESQLPQTYRDAIAIARGLGIQYLWIDSLAIIQDSTSDWEMEAANMAAIYTNSLLTIAAVESPDADGGCYLNSIKTRVRRGFWKSEARGGSSELQVAAFLPYKRSNTSSSFLRHDHGPLFRRGWTLQEEICANRVVYFYQDQMRWQCCTIFNSEDDTETRRVEVPNSSIYSPLNTLIWSGKTVKDEQLIGLTGWYKAVTDYSTRLFTQESDRLPALAGLISHFERLSGATPVLGLWAELLATDLAWWWAAMPDQRDDILASTPHAGVPSWSWLRALPGHIFVYGEYPHHLSAHDGRPYETAWHGYKADWAFTLIQYTVQWEGSPWTSPLLEASLIVRSLSRLLFQHSDADLLRQLNDPKFEDLFAREYPPDTFNVPRFAATASGAWPKEVTPKQLDFYRDPYDCDLDITEACILLLTQYRGRVLKRVDPRFRAIGMDMEDDYLWYALECFLVLVPTGRSDEYRRIGLGYSCSSWGEAKEPDVEKQLFRDAGEMTITLV